MKYLILCKSLTNAQRAALLLERRGLSASVVKAPQHLRENGCGYALSLYRRLDEAVSLLQNNRLLTGRIYQRLEDGSYQEVEAGDLSR
ncbi:MAG: DUF3343 domain-containing protein [Oscillospiraceae bacterium]|nr:DUF3343 domain-containing protein [Oscillospiraceae bacterium]